MTRRTAAKRKPLKPEVVAAELARLRAEIVMLGEIVLRLERTLDRALRPTPESEPWDDLVGVAEASETAEVEPQTIRRWLASGAPIGAYVESLGIFLISRRRLREYLGARNGTRA